MKAPDSNGIESTIDDLVKPSLSSDEERAKSKSHLNGSFKSSLRLAVLSDPEVVAAQASWREAAAGIDAAGSAFKPQTEVSMNAGALREDFASGARDTLGASANIYVNQLVYDGGAATARISAAQIAASGAEENTRKVASEVALEAAKAWVDYQTYDRRIALLDMYLDRGRILIGQLTRLTDSGIVDKSVAGSAQMELQGLDLERLRFVEGQSEAQSRLSRFFPKIPSELPAATSPLEGGTPEILSGHWSQSPVVRGAAAEVLRAREELAIAEATKKPTVGLRAGANSPMSEADSTDYVLGFQINWTLGDGGRRDANIRSAKERLAGLEYTFENAKAAAERTLKSSLSQRASLLQSLDIVKEQKRRAEDQRDAAESQLTTGQSSIRQLVDSNIRAYRVSDQLLALEAQLLTLDLYIAAATGRILVWISVD